MLKELEKYFEKVNSYCLPYKHLEDLYKTIGFKKIKNKDAPLFMQEKLIEYAEKEIDCIIMKRNTKNLKQIKLH